MKLHEITWNYHEIPLNHLEIPWNVYQIPRLTASCLQPSNQLRHCKLPHLQESNSCHLWKWKLVMNSLIKPNFHSNMMSSVFFEMRTCRVVQYISGSLNILNLSNNSATAVQILNFSTEKLAFFGQSLTAHRPKKGQKKAPPPFASIS